MKKLFILCIIWLICNPLSSQSITRAEYFIDTDPGYGNATPLTIQSGENQEISFTIPISNLFGGLHTLFVRAKDDDGNWGQTFSRIFWVQRMPEDFPANLERIEFFVDADPGFGLADPASFQEGNAVTVNLLLPLESLSLGLHTLFFRAKDIYGVWGATFSRYFLIQETPYLTQIEYFLDTDPGYGQGIPADFLSAPNVVIDLSIPLDTIAPGLHRLYVRGKDQTGAWGQTFSGIFLTQHMPEAMPAPLTRIEYFFDEDPGFEMGIPVDFLSSHNLVIDLSIPLDTIAPGLHRLYVRGQDQAGVWGQTFSGIFLTQHMPETMPATLTKIEYFLDEDPGFGEGIPIDFQTGPNIILDLSLPLHSIPEGIHSLSVRARDENGVWGSLFHRIFVKQAGQDDVALVTSIEYFLNEDPGFGNGVPVSLNAPLQDVRKYFVVNPDLLQPGENRLFVRALDDQGRWSMVYHEIFQVLEAALCEPPSDLVANEITETTAELTWSQEGSESVWDILWAPAGFDFTEAGILKFTVSSNNYQVADLQTSTLYEFYVRKSCSDGQVSAWAGPASFHTLPLAYNQLSLLADPPEGGTLTGEGSYAFGEDVTITATPNSNFVFQHWSGDTEYLDDPQEATATVTMPAAPLTLTAHFLDVTGISDISEKSLRVFPNPAIDQLHIEFYASGKEIILQLMNMQGQVVEQLTFDEPGKVKASLTIAELPAGLYLIVIQGDGLNRPRKVVIGQ